MDDRLGTIDCPAQVARVEQVADEGFRCSLIEELFDLGGDVERPNAVPGMSQGSDHAPAGPPVRRSYQDHLGCLSSVARPLGSGSSSRSDCGVAAPGA